MTQNKRLVDTAVSDGVLMATNLINDDNNYYGGNEEDIDNLSIRRLVIRLVVPNVSILALMRSSLISI